MNTRVSKDYTFLSSIHFDNRFMVNLYEMNISMVIQTFDMLEQNIAIERVNYFISTILEESIFINNKEVEFIEKYNNAGLRCCLIPEDPFDQIIGLILMNKCNAIMEDRIHITDMIFGSKLSNLIKFELTSEMAINEYPGKYWWNDNTMSTASKPKKKDKIINLFDNKDNDWANLELIFIKK